MNLGLSPESLLKDFCDRQIHRGLSFFKRLNPVSTFIVEDFFENLASGEAISESEVIWSREERFKVIERNGEWQVLTDCGKPFVTVEGHGQDRVIKVAIVDGFVLEGRKVYQDDGLAGNGMNWSPVTLCMAAVGLITQNKWNTQNAA